MAHCGAGYSDDGTWLVVPHDRAVVIFWSLNDICGRRGNWEYKMEHLAGDVYRLARMSHFAGLVIFVIGGSARVCHLPVAFDTARNAVIKILRDHGCTAFSGEAVFEDLSWHRHVNPKGLTDYWHFKECVATVSTFDHWLELIMRFTACSLLPMAWLHMH